MRKRPARALVVLSVAVVLLAVMLPGMAGLLAATVEPVWTLLEIVAVVVERVPEREAALPRALVLAPAGLRAPPEYLA